MAVDPLSEILKVVHLRGEAALLCSPIAPFAIAFPSARASLHVVTRGPVQVDVEGEEQPLLLGNGDVMLLVHGTAHVVFDDVRAVVTPIEQALADDFDVDRHTLGSADSVRWTWCSFRFDEVVASRLLRALPRVIVLRGLERRPIEWMNVCCELVVSESKNDAPGSAVMISRLLDLLFVQIVRRWVEDNKLAPGWLGGAMDVRMQKALKALHADPAHPWTVGELADAAGMSRSSFAARFQEAIGETPGSYLTGWRLDLSAEQLRHSPRTVADIASSVGYESEAAFSRAFRQRFGEPPAKWRRPR